ncbi:MAG: LysR family transcriptional regulator [Tabrizicola sp.]|uniref:LysR family transcriptional regulator n=1 Tax=Tabrizicola sp. TaxID=2005166 RepID=UPI002AB877E8|nr:LysR family transcriptional regulator [Tabrizicola sp.]MDZ4086958.1 LysR family transcriptional regulator [Tabrizicola sp.]
MDLPDWTLIRSFLAVAEAGSLSAAARATGISQPTLGRHIQTIQAQLQVPLFTRIAQGQALTEAGQALLPSARAMQAAAAELALTAKGRSGGIEGTVRITASRVVSHVILPRVLALLREAEPGIQIDLVPSDTTENLLFGEADIALRMYRPTQADLVARHIGDLPLGLYAAKDYLNRRGHPTTPEDLMQHDFIGQDRMDQIIRVMRTLGMEVGRSFFPVRCDDPLTYVELIRAGCGLGGILRAVGDADPTLERIDVIPDLPSLPVWLTAAPRLRQSPRLRRVWDALARGFHA